MDEKPSQHPRRRRAAAWGVHAFTALGLPLAFLGAAALARGDARTFFIIACVACVVDAADGTMARKVGVREVLPQFDGRRLDDLVDFLHFAFLPSLALPALGMLPEGQAWLGMIPLLASGYGFSQEAAKTEVSFVGFPSYWNIVVGYLYVLGASPEITVGLVVLLAILVFVPIHYVYPTKAPFFQRLTVGLGAFWALLMLIISLFITEPWARTLGWISLFYPAYYMVLSFMHHRRIHEALGGGGES
ncbi:MAG: CDP-alcohol phosphatidyltransferase [Proteobacteria bacterium]|nr:CDP-alcohol phosphatidyltransferase [Pseudomonadota bacterium]